MESYAKYQKAKSATNDARRWFDMRLKRDSQSNTPFSVSKGSISFTMYGQDYAGAKNYHDSPDELNAALREVILARWEELTAAAMQKLEAVERKAMVACKDDLNKMLSAIEQAEAS
jgi:hypothetical protein